MVTNVWERLKTLALSWIAMCMTHSVSIFHAYLTMEIFCKTSIMIPIISTKYSVENTSVSNKDYLKIFDIK